MVANKENKKKSLRTKEENKHIYNSTLFTKIYLTCSLVWKTVGETRDSAKSFSSFIISSL